jgi:hypothetical protein
VSEIVKVSIEVHSRVARFDVAVQAENIRRAVELVGGRYPGRDVKVKFPSVLEGLKIEQPAQKLAA